MDIPLHSACSFIRSHECGLLALDKAAGVLSHPNHSQKNSSALLQVPYNSSEEAYHDGHKKWYLLNRLDAPTSGVILMATERELADVVKQLFAGHRVAKRYFALVKGIPPRRKDSWKDCLEVMRKGGKLRTTVRPGRPNAQTGMSLEQRGNGPPARALLRLDPATGRTHQLRVQCSSRHLPIIGDATYGDFSFNKGFRSKTGSNRLFLHSHQTELDFELSGTRIRFKAVSDLPDIFAVALQ